ncbi:hypothetical protein AB0L06_29160 [Spirillospora sp. NPDC052269]
MSEPSQSPDPSPLRPKPPATAPEFAVPTVSAEVAVPSPAPVEPRGPAAALRDTRPKDTPQGDAPSTDTPSRDVSPKDSPSSQQLPPIVNVNVHVPATPPMPPAPPAYPVPPAPPSPPAAPPPPPPRPPAGLDNSAHAVHLILTAVTCGLWIPVWVVHAVVAGNRQPPLPPAPPQPWQQPISADQANRAAVQHMNARAQRRREARALAADNPLMARELRIGRTDLPPAQRPYDDGGLIDVNAVPARELTRFGMTPEQAEKAVELRDGTGGFSSGEDLAVVCDLPPRLVPELVEYGLYLR